MQKHVDLVDLVESFRTDSYSNAYLLAKFGVDTAENEHCKVCPLSASPDPPGAGPRGAPAPGAGAGRGVRDRHDGAGEHAAGCASGLQEQAIVTKLLNSN